MNDSWDYLREKYSAEDFQKLKDVMYEPVLDVETEWVTTDDGKFLQWICSECGEESFTEVRYSTTRCDSCFRTMQASNYSIDPSNPDPENPDWYLERLDRSEEEAEDHTESEPETQSVLDW